MIENMDTNTLLAKGRGIARALKAISARRGKDFTMHAKPGRFELQKTVYLLKRLKYPAASKFDYNIYLNGPYSPDLAQVYYALENAGLANAPPASDVPANTTRVVMAALSRGEDFLEGLTTVLDGSLRAGSLPQGLAWAKSIKPHLNEQTWGEVRAFLVQHPELTRLT